MNELAKTKEQDLTLKQRKWIKEYLACGNAKKAALKVYDCTAQSAGQIGYENLNKLDYTEFLEAAGITDNLLQKKIMEGLDANKTVSAVKTSREAGVDSTDFIDVPDFLARHKYLETALKLKKRLVDRKEFTGKDGEPIQYQIITGTGYIPSGVVIDATPEENLIGGQSSVQNGSVASESPQNNDSHL
jgi:hypothetical protein